MVILKLQKTIATLLFYLKRRMIEKSDLHFLVFSGTSGKTMTRNCVTHILEKSGKRVISPHSGYTNELGISLASLGIQDVSLWSLKVWRDIFHAKSVETTYVCIELGADFRSDILWFLKYFKPAIVFLTDSDNNSWGRDVQDIITERRMLIQALPRNAKVFFFQDNRLAQAVVENVDKRKVIEIPYILDLEQDWEQQKTEIQILFNTRTYIFQFSKFLFLPQLRAIYLSLVYAIEIQEIKVTDDLFKNFSFSKERLAIHKSLLGVFVVSDTYKAIPFCTKWFLSMTQAIPASRKFLILSEMRPAPNNIAQEYQHIQNLLYGFKKIYFVGPVTSYNLLTSSKVNIKHISPERYADLVQQLKQDLQHDDVLFIKGSFVYELYSVVDQITSTSRNNTNDSNSTTHHPQQPQNQ